MPSKATPPPVPPPPPGGWRQRQPDHATEAPQTRKDAPQPASEPAVREEIRRRVSVSVLVVAVLVTALVVGMVTYLVTGPRSDVVSGSCRQVVEDAAEVARTDEEIVDSPAGSDRENAAFDAYFKALATLKASLKDCDA